MRAFSPAGAAAASGSFDRGESGLDAGAIASGRKLMRRSCSGGKGSRMSLDEAIGGPARLTLNCPALDAVHSRPHGGVGPHEGGRIRVCGGARGNRDHTGADEHPRASRRGRPQEDRFRESRISCSLLGAPRLADSPPSFRSLSLPFPRARLAAGGQRGEEPRRRGSNLLHGTRERLIACPRRRRRPADLADVLQRCGANLVLGRGWLEMVQDADVAAHGESEA